MKKKTHEEYVNEVAIKNPSVKVVGKYVDAKTPVLHKCLIHNLEWNVTPNNILNGRGCPECKKQKTRERCIKTHKQYVSELKDVNPNILVVDKYIGANISILHQCLIDGYKWYAQPNNILNGFGCPKCSKRFRRTHEDYVCEVFTINPNIQVMEEFNGLQTPILHTCKSHNINWLTTPENILNGCGCYKCGNEKIGDKSRKTHNQYINELKDTNHNIIVLGTYINATTPILHKCLIDEYEWNAQPSNILSGKGCPQCNESHGERAIRLWLGSHEIAYEPQKVFDDCRDIKPLPFDFYLPNHNVCIEYDGKQHFEPIDHFGGEKAFEKTVTHDNIKNEYCKNNSISLLRIPYYKNVEEELNNFLFI